MLLNKKNIEIKFSDKVKKIISTQGYDPVYGARPLKRVIQNLILDELALEIIEGKIKDGDKIMAEENKGEISFKTN